MDEQRYTLTEHLSELRSRLGRGLLLALLCALASLMLADDLFAWMAQPMKDALPEGSKFVVTSPMEYVLTTLQIALTFGLVLASPYILYQLWSFVAPGLYATEQKLVRILVLSVCMCFMGGAAFAYFLVFPTMLRFLIEMTPPDIAGMYSVDLYFGFFLRIMLAFGVAFELPVAIVLLCWLGILNPDALAKARRYAIVLAFVVAAVLTPTTDPYSQSLMALPLIVLYEVGVWAARLVGTREARDAATPPPPAPKPTGAA